MNSSAEFTSLIQRSESVLLLGKKEATNEELCSLLFLKLLAESLGKKVSCVGDWRFSERFLFLKGSAELARALPQNQQLSVSLPVAEGQVKNLSHKFEDGMLKIFLNSSSDIDFSRISWTSNATEQFDLVITVGVNTPSEIGKFWESNPSLFQKLPIVNISASAANTHFGKLNINPMNSRSCAEILESLMQHSHFQMSAEMAEVLFTGIISISQNFNVAGFSSSDFFAASRLMQKGISHSQIIDESFRKTSAGKLKLFSRIIRSLSFDPMYKTAWALCTEEDLAETHTQITDAVEWADRVLQYNSGADMFFLVAEKEGKGIGYIFADLADIIFPEGIETQQRGSVTVVSSDHTSLYEMKSVILQMRETLYKSTHPESQIDKIHPFPMEFFIQQKKKKDSPSLVQEKPAKDMNGSIPFSVL